jgi:hypothetical protein
MWCSASNEGWRLCTHRSAHDAKRRAWKHDELVGLLSKIVFIVSHTCLFCCRKLQKEEVENKKGTVIPLGNQNITGPERFRSRFVVICDAPIFLISTKAPNTIVKPRVLW